MIEANPHEPATILELYGDDGKRVGFAFYWLREGPLMEGNNPIRLSSVFPTPRGIEYRSDGSPIQ